MRTIEILRSILLNIRANKIRVFLTTLGVIIGTLTIIIVVGIGKGGEQAVQEQFKKLSAQSINIMKNRDYNKSKQLTLEDLTKLEALEHVERAGSVIRTTGDISYGSVSQSVSIQGQSESIQEINNLNILHGTYITDEDGSKRRRVIVLGYSLAELFFGEEPSQAIGEKVSVKGRKYDVVGVLKQEGDSGKGDSIDDGAIVPIKIAQSYLSGRMTMLTFVAKATQIDTVEKAISEINEYILTLTETEGAYNLMDAGSRLTTALESANMMATLLIGVAAVVLVVGGIGIMNVLLVSVRERTREIGILKSIGAKREDIIKEFLLEAVIISFLGGLIGVGLSFITIPIVLYLGLLVVQSIEGIMLGLLFSVTTGIFFGVYPAVKASKLKPIEALNYEG
ncbi:ABC transporter permease [Cellulosilyticum sp. I15G10I2]|uniref:ABC transporter permease n=1 Tax=Cellulosilyticum sp. I15G10I2 TaxID=1892843 RepID=UPI00085BF0CD|nr:ABC transporter permease [Cellulosilyticum sp. I15G10I2]